MVTAQLSGERGIAFAWQCVAGVLDPEVPVLSIVELGIVRAVTPAPDGFVVTITPTYSGCPALEAIVADIEGAFAQQGAHATVATVLAPAWSTDWIAPEARERLRAYGIAPPHTLDPRTPVSRVDVAGISPLRRRPEPVACPRCASTHTELVSQFGSTACKALYRCADCAEPFDYMKPH
jgi:ring-1,2-phenylacetyl-CoA epoxidase subunit PaaD